MAEPPHFEAESTSDITSPFLRLPLELREAIYHLVFGTQTIHITRQFCSSRHGDLGATICRLPRSDWNDNYALSQVSEKDHRGLFRSDAQGSVRNYTAKHWQCSEIPIRNLASATGMSLLHVCRQLHRDTATMPYRVSTFCFTDEFALETFVTEALTQRQREAITHVQLSLSVRAGVNFAACMLMLPNLRKLELHVAYLNGDLFTPWLQAAAREPDDHVDFPVRLSATTVEVIAGFDRDRLADHGRAARRRVARRLECFLIGLPVDDDAEVPKGKTDRSMASWRYLLRNGCSI